MLELALVHEIIVMEMGLWAVLAVRMVVYQPQFFPRLHYLARILNADIYGVADNVQFVRKHAYHTAEGNRAGPSYQAHTPILTQSGVLLVDFATENGFKPINEARIVYTARNDKGRPLRLIAEHYRKAPQYKNLMPALEEFFAREYVTVADLNIASVYFALSILLEVDPARRGDRNAVHDALAQSPFRLRRIELLSESGVPLSDKERGRCANEWLIDSCARYGAREYYFGGTGAAAYMDFNKFHQAGITLVEQSWRCTPYRQTREGFVPNLSIIDLLMNVPPAEARDMLHAKE